MVQLTPGLAAGDGYDQVDPVAVIDRPFQFIRAGRLSIHIYLDKWLQLPILVIDPFAEPWIAADKRFDTRADGGALNLDDFVFIGQRIKVWMKMYLDAQNMPALSFTTGQDR